MRTQIAIVSTLFLLSNCSKDKPITNPFKDTFERTDVGSDYKNTGGPYQIKQGRLVIAGAYNHPLWLKKRIPENAIVEFDAMSASPYGDIKIEIWGDGKTYAKDKGAYLSSSYVFIFGGWGNSISALCRLDEHSNDRKTRSDIKVEPNRNYRFRIERRSNGGSSEIKWFIDDKLFLDLNDSSPLTGSDHGYLGFNNWESELYFDNLTITPL